MEIEFLPNNLHLEAPDRFSKIDPHLKRMGQQVYVYHSDIIDQIPIDIPGIYNLGGGRQVGKTTLLKQWMLHLLNNRVAPQSICFLSCELIVDEHSLYRIVTNQLEEMPAGKMRYFILDEITYVRDWDKAIKYLADIGAFENVVVVISGSDLTMMQEARKRFPGRRGKAPVVDFHYFPLSFREFVTLKGSIPKDLELSAEPSGEMLSTLYKEFDQYLIHGGFLTAINEYALTKTIGEQTLATYSDWVRGDMIKRDKKEHYLREIVGAIIKHYSSQISWRELVKDLSVDHVQTAIDYVNLLESMDAVFVQAALIEDKLVGAPKKSRKFMFNDPFIYHALAAWLRPSKDPFLSQIIPNLETPQICSSLVEACVVTHYRRYYDQTYYIKADGEVDVAYVHGNKFWPVEVKWTSQLRPSELKQVLKYPNAVVWAKVGKRYEVSGTPVIPLPWGLLGLS